MDEISLANLARWAQMPQSQNLDDRRTADPLAIHYGDAQRPFSLGTLAAQHPMNFLPPQTGSPLAQLAGFNDVEDPDYYERRPQFSRQETMSLQDQFRMLMMKHNLKLGGQ